MSPILLLLAGIGGAIGAACRAYLIAAIEKRFKNWLFTGAFFVNCCSCFIAGFCFALSLGGMPTALLMAGFCGGFSTLSSVNLDAVNYLRSGKEHAKLHCFGYLVMTYGATLIAAALGFALCHLL